MTRTAPNPILRTTLRRTRKTLVAALVAGLALGSSSAIHAQPLEPAAELLTVVGDWEGPDKLGNDAAVEGLAVEITSSLLDRATPRLSFQGFDGQFYEAELERFERPVIGGSLWIGRVTEYGSHSKVLLANIEGYVSGSIDTPEGRYEISPRPDGHVMMKLDPERYAGCDAQGDKDDDEHEHPLPAPLFDQAADTLGLDPVELRAMAADKGADKSNVTIGIVVFFSDTAANALGGHLAAGSLASSAVASLDDAFVNSGIGARAQLNAWSCLGASSVGDSSGSNDGVVLALYSNGSSFSNSNDKEWHQARAEFGQTANNYDSYGEALAVGDFDNNGYDDLAIGIPGETVNGKSDAGAVRILYGSSSRLTSTGTDFLHQDVSGVNGVVESGDQFGFALTTGDFDGDGYDDLVVGNPFEDIGSTSNAGMINVLYGASGGITTSGDQSLHLADIGVTGKTDDRLGYALASGDFDGDGYDDIAIGVPWKEFGATDAGWVLVINGSSSGLNFGHRSELAQMPHLTPGESAEGYDRFGYSLASGDFNNDGFDDLGVGVPYEDVSGKNNAGVVHTFLGSPIGLAKFFPTQTYNQGNLGGGTETNDYFGWALAVGDLNGDGRDDLAVSAPYEDSNNRGRVHVLKGTSSGVANSGYYFSGASGDEMGYAMVIADFNEDGYDDLALGEPGANVVDADGDTAGDAGAVTIFHGGTGVPTYASTWHQESNKIAGEAEANDSLGAALAAGDFDNDGDYDLAIGVPGEGVSNHSDYFETWMGGSSTIATIRDDYDADLIGLIVQNLESGICGSAQGVLGSTAGDSTLFYQVTKRSCVHSNYSFAHEMGHLIGLAHDPVTLGSGSTSGACTTSGGAEYARGHFVSGQGRSIMSYGSPCSSSCPAEPMFSNPNLDFSFGQDSGIANERDNARCANLTVGKVAAYQ